MADVVDMVDARYARWNSRQRAERYNRESSLIGDGFAGDLDVASSRLE